MGGVVGDAAGPAALSDRRTVRLALLAAAVGCACFVNALPNEFAYDEFPQIVENRVIRSLRNFRQIWLGSYVPDLAGEQARLNPNPDRLYRPVTSFSFALNYATGGPRGWSFRLTNLLLHGLCCFLLWHFAWRLSGDRRFATWAALLFAVHPVHCEAVAYIVGRAEVLVAVFMLAGALILLSRDGVVTLRRSWAATGVFLLALLSKETAVCYLAVALLLIHGLGRRPQQRRWQWWAARTAILLLPLVIYLPARYLALEGHWRRPGSPLFNPVINADLAGRVLMPLEILGHYVRLLVFPLHLSVDYGYGVLDPRGGPNAMTAAGAAAAIGLLAALAGYRRPSGFWRSAALLSALWWVSYFLFSNMVLLLNISVAERAMYWPSAPACLLVVLVVRSLWDRLSPADRGGARAGPLRAKLPRAGAALAALMLCAMAGRTVARNRDWRDPLALFAADLRSYPRSAVLNACAASEHAIIGLQVDDPEDRRRRLELADAHIARALETFPWHWGYQMQRSAIRAALGDIEGAITHARWAADLNRKDAALQARLGQLLIQAGRRDEGLVHLERAAALEPADAALVCLLGQQLLEAGQLQRAIPYLRGCAAADPTNTQARAVLAAVLTASAPIEALRYARELCALQPEDLGSRLLLAEALIASGNTPEGTELYRQIQQALSPEDPNYQRIEQRLRRLSPQPAPAQTAPVKTP